MEILEQNDNFGNLSAIKIVSFINVVKQHIYINPKTHENLSRIGFLSVNFHMKRFSRTFIQHPGLFSEKCIAVCETHQGL